VKINYHDCTEDLIVFGDINKFFDDGEGKDRVIRISPNTEDEFLGDDDYYTVPGELWAVGGDDDDDDEGVEGDNDGGDGALMASNGYYIGYSGDKVIGMTSNPNAPTLYGKAFGATSTPSCIIAGKFNLMNFN
jgi:hypothetical protein